jgi:hypothetical protein
MCVVCFRFGYYRIYNELKEKRAQSIEHRVESRERRAERTKR